LGVSDWGISPATLDDVFTSIRLCVGTVYEEWKQGDVVHAGME